MMTMIRRPLQLAMPALAATTSTVIGWITAKTFLKSKDQGFMGWGVNLLGGGAFAMIGSFFVRNPAIRTGLWVGAAMSPLLRMTTDVLRSEAVKGALSKIGVVTGFEGYSDRMSDYLIATSDNGERFSDYLVPAAAPAAVPEGMGQHYELGYNEGGANIYG